jgi:hypothetical protein
MVAGILTALTLSGTFTPNSLEMLDSVSFFGHPTGISFEIPPRTTGGEWTMLAVDFAIVTVLVWLLLRRRRLSPPDQPLPDPESWPPQPSKPGAPPAA